MRVIASLAELSRGTTITGIGYSVSENQVSPPTTIPIEISGPAVSCRLSVAKGNANVRIPEEQVPKQISKGSKLAAINYLNRLIRIRSAGSPFRFIDLFAGIGGMRLGFEPFGGECVFTSEWDRLAQQTYHANFGEMPFGDITTLNPKDVPDHDILLAGFPCQPFSIIGNRLGFDDTRGTLFHSIASIIRAKFPTAILLENVKQFRTHDNGRTCETVLAILRSLGYHVSVTVLNALDFGVPQKRERTFIVGFLRDTPFTFPKPLPFRADLKDIIDPDAEEDESLAATDYIRQKRAARASAQGTVVVSPSVWHENKGGHLGIHPFSCALRHNASHNYLLLDGRRRLSGRECLRLQGFPDSFKIVVPHRAIRAQAGNAVAVPVIASIASEMLHSLSGSAMHGSTRSGYQSELFAANQTT